MFADFVEEGWPSMDLCAEMLHRSSELGLVYEVANARPTYARLCGRLPVPYLGKLTRNIDRMVNRWVVYPRAVAKQVSLYDLYHVVDHSYAHLVHRLPADKTGVYCHDLDTFRCLTQPDLEPRPWWFKAMARRILTGLQSSAVVFYSTKAVYADLVRYALVEPEKLVHAPYGVDSTFVASESHAYPRELAALKDQPWLLHVGATIPRKRIDVLLAVFAAARKSTPGLRLCKLGSNWTVEQVEQIERDGLRDSIVHLGKVDQALLVRAYQLASAVLITSDAEGFGLPVIEALACGVPVIASDIPVLRETGGAAACYAPVGDIGAWVQKVELVVRNDVGTPSRGSRLEWASQFCWKKHAQIIADAYAKLLLPTSAF